MKLGWEARKEGRGAVGMALLGEGASLEGMPMSSEKGRLSSTTIETKVRGGRNG